MGHYPRADIDEWETALVKAGFITEEERVRRAFRRILDEQLRRNLFTLEPRP